MAKTITGLHTGTTRITATFTDGSITTTGYVDFTVNKGDGYIATPPIAATGLTCCSVSYLCGIL